MIQELLRDRIVYPKPPPAPPPPTLRDELREAQQMARASAQDAEKALAISNRGATAVASAMAAHRVAEDEVKAYHAEILRAGPGPADAEHTQQLVAARQAAKLALTDAEAAAAIVASEHAGLRQIAEAARAAANRAVTPIVEEAVTELMVRMHEAEVETGRLRLLFMSSPQHHNQVSPYRHDPIHLPAVQAAERAGHRPEPDKWHAFAQALHADPEAQFTTDAGG